MCIDTAAISFKITDTDRRPQQRESSRGSEPTVDIRRKRNRATADVLNNSPFTEAKKIIDVDIGFGVCESTESMETTSLDLSVKVKQSCKV